MKKSIILSIWILLTALYCWNISDIGRSMGAKVNSAIECIASDDIGDRAYYSIGYSDLDNDFKFDFTVSAVTSVIYLVFTIGCYHFAFIKTKIKICN